MQVKDKQNVDLLPFISSILKIFKLCFGIWKMVFKSKLKSFIIYKEFEENLDFGYQEQHVGKYSDYIFKVWQHLIITDSKIIIKN